MPFNPATQHKRFGPQGSGGIKLLFKTATGRAAPTSELEAFQFGARFSQVQWTVKMPAGITSYDVQLWRWVKSADKYAVGVWVREGGTTTYSNSATFYQDIHGNGLTLEIGNLVGSITTPGDQFEVLGQGINQ